MHVQALIDRIRRDGRALNEQVLLVDSFLNHQIDPGLMAQIGREFARLFAGLSITRVATIESSGIAPALMAALELGVPLVVMKRQPSRITRADVLCAPVHSFTKDTDYQLTVSCKYLQAGDRVLLIDDFLAHGEAACGAAAVIEKAGATLCGIGIVIEKAFQQGRARIDRLGCPVHSLARIARMSEGEIEFLGD